MKQIKFFLLTALLSMVGTRAIAHDIEVANADGVTIYYKWANNQTELSVSYPIKNTIEYSNNKYSGNVVIPESVAYNGATYPVTTIGGGAFSDCSRLTSVTIPNSVTSIGENAFRSCSRLTSVTIPNSVTSIGGDAFWRCSGLTSIVVESGNSKYDSRENCNAIIETASNTLIAGCMNSFIPNSVTSIGGDAFFGCSGLTSITIPNSVTSIGHYAFYNCYRLTSVTIPNSVTSIGWSAFSGCSGLTSVTIPNSVTSIGNYAFSRCSGLTSVTIPNSVTSIGNYAFDSCSGLTSVTIPNSVTSIGEYAFYNCYRLTSVTIPNSVTSIGSSAFRGCSGLTSVTIPNSVTNIGNEAFENCSGLTSVTIPNSVTSIGNYVFSGCSGLTSVTIPNSVTRIGIDAFSQCYFARENFVNNSTLSSDNDWGATLCDKETEDGLLINNNSVVKCRKWATSVSIPNSVTSIGYNAFYNCINLTSVTIPNSVTSIGNSAFYWCSGLTSVTIPNSVTSIGNQAFTGCSGLTSVSIGKNVTYIQYGLFAGCTSLKDVYCYIEEVPFTATDAFDFVDKKNATLHVPDAAVSEYKSIAPWGYFGTIVGLGTNSAKQTEATPVLIQSENGRISVSGAGDGTAISVFGTNGVKVGAAVSHGGQAVINTNLSSGSVAIVKIGEKSVKVVVK